MSAKPLVSICCITFNHAPYIGECIQGFLMQQTDFPIEILIFDDASTDGTQDFLKDSAAKDSRIRLFLQKENQWKKKKYGLLEWLFPASNGKYIALCEGDDYWTDPLKLQKQVDFLEAKQKYSMCFTRSFSLRNGQLKLQSLPKRSRDYSFFDFIKENICFSNTIVVRSSLIKEMIHDLASQKGAVTAGDWFMVLFMAKKGKVRYLADATGVYRWHSTGIWSSLGFTEKLEAGIKQMELFDAYFKYEYHNEFMEAQRLRRLKYQNYTSKNHKKKRGWLYRVLAFLKKSAGR
jgi:glycosyltransferase involved in cell wall biosynthesis